jgi:hypothetical protein
MFSGYQLSILGVFMSKDPKSTALNKMKEQVNKDWDKKIEDQTKIAVDAGKAFINAKNLLRELVDNKKDDIASFVELTKGI